MAKLANFSSPRPAKAQLQAALFYARKKNKARRETNPVQPQSVWGESAIIIGTGEEFGFLLGSYGSVVQQINPAHPLVQFTSNNADTITLVVSGNAVDYMTDRSFFVIDFEGTGTVSYDSGSNRTTAEFSGLVNFIESQVVYFGFGEDS